MFGHVYMYLQVFKTLLFLFNLIFQRGTPQLYTRF